MKHISINFHAIQTSDILYYDADFEARCFQFCQARNIDCLPALDDPLRYWRRTEHGFTREEVALKKRVNGHANIFASHVLELFRDNHLLFVYANDELTGVAHFSDYNRPEVDAYLFGLLSAYERSLRKLLKLSDKGNCHMLEYFQWVVDNPTDSNQKSVYKRKIKLFDKYRSENDKLPAFERFYLDDLIELAGYLRIIDILKNTNELRNMVMHAHELVHREDAKRDDYIYDFDSFEKFFNLVQSLLQDYKKVNNKIAFLELCGG